MYFFSSQLFHRLLSPWWVWCCPRYLMDTLVLLGNPATLWAGTRSPCLHQLEPPHTHTQKPSDWVVWNLPPSNQKFTFSQFWRLGILQILSAYFILDKSLLPVLQTAAFLLYPYMERTGSSLFSSYNSINPIMRAPPIWPDYLPKASKCTSKYQVTLGIRIFDIWIGREWWPQTCSP